MDTPSVPARIRYAIRNALAQPLDALFGHRWETVTIDQCRWTICMRCGVNS